MHRITRPGGRLYFSINDHHAVDLFEGKGDPVRYERYYERTGGRHEWDDFVAFLHGRPEYDRFKRHEAYMITMGRSTTSHVMWDADALCRRLEYGFRKVAVTPKATATDDGSARANRVMATSTLEPRPFLIRARHQAVQVTSSSPRS